MYIYIYKSYISLHIYIYIISKPTMPKELKYLMRGTITQMQLQGGAVRGQLSKIIASAASHYAPAPLAITKGLVFQPPERYESLSCIL